MPSALKKPTLDELYRRLRDLDYTQVDERMAVILNAILQVGGTGRVPGVCDRSGFDGRLHHRMEYPIKSKPGGCPGTWMEQ